MGGSIPRSSRLLSHAPSVPGGSRRGDRSLVARYTPRCDAGWSSQVARRAHNPEVAGSNPAPATAEGPGNGAFRVSRIERCVGASVRGYAFHVVWLYLLLAVVVGIAIWLAIVVIKWLFILAVVAGLIWLLLVVRRRLAR